MANNGLQCPCECNRGGFCGGCGHAGCSNGINVGRRPSPWADFARVEDARNQDRLAEIRKQKGQ